MDAFCPSSHSFPGTINTKLFHYLSLAFYVASLTAANANLCGTTGCILQNPSHVYYIGSSRYIVFSFKRAHLPEPLCVFLFVVVGIHFFITVKRQRKTRREARVKWLDARRSENFAAFHAAATRRPNKTTPTSKMAQRGQQITAHQDTQQERSTDDTRCGLYAVANSNPKYFSRRQNNDAKTTLSGPTKQRDDSSDCLLYTSPSPRD